jgi:hypothetical protein
MLLRKLIGSTAFGSFQQGNDDLSVCQHEQKARIIPRTILITKSSSKTSFWVQDHSFATHRMFSKLSCSATLWTRTDCKWRSVSCMTYSVYKYVVFLQPLDLLAVLHNARWLIAVILPQPCYCGPLSQKKNLTYKQSNNDLDSKAVFVPFNFQNSHDRQTHTFSQYYCQAFPVVVGTFVLTKIRIFWATTPYELENIYRRFWWTCGV